MFTFNLQKLEKQAGDNDLAFNFLLLKWWRDRNIIPRRLDPYKLKEPLTGGSSFLINPEAILKDKNADPIYKAQYIKLAARRDLMLYNQYGVTTLDLSFFPDINRTNIKFNPLINIRDNTIHFKYE